MNFEKNVDLSAHTTLCVGGRAKYFIRVNRENDLISALDLARKKSLKVLIMGGASNLLISDKGFDGLVIKNDIKSKSCEDSKIRCSSGTLLQDLINFQIEKGLSGMESLSGIPGTVGGAIYGNAGAYGQSINDYLLRVKIYDGRKVKWISKRQCRFDYRESIFKRRNWVILEGEFQLKNGDRQAMRKKAKEIVKERLKKYPPDLKCPGSFFKNIVADNLPKSILKEIPNEKIIFGKIPAGYLLEEVGMKGYRIGNIKIADYHGNLIINEGGGKAKDVYKLMKICIKKVKDRFGITLEPEVQLVGFK